MPRLLKSHFTNALPVEKHGIYTVLSDGTEAIDCQAMAQDTGLPLPVIKSEIEHHHMHGRHFYKRLGTLVERGCYESWKAERLEGLRAKLAAKHQGHHA